jgi:hypothetical protein
MNRKIVEGKRLQVVGRALQGYARQMGDTFTLLVGKRLMVKGIARVIEGMRQEAARVPPLKMRRRIAA